MEQGMVMPPRQRQGGKGMAMPPRSDRAFASMGRPMPSRPPVTPLYKTRLCNYHVRGACTKGAACHFAHGIEDLRTSPDFERTSVCPTMLRLGRCDKLRCRYAHSADELRSAPGLLKTKLCRFYLNGQCVVGSACRFAHTVDELEQAVEVQRSTARATPQNRQMGPKSSGPQRDSGFVPGPNAMPARPSDDVWEMRRSAFLEGQQPLMPFLGNTEKPMYFCATPSDSGGSDDGIEPKQAPPYNVNQPPFPQRSMNPPPHATQQHRTESDATTAAATEAGGISEPDEPGPAQVIGGRVVVQLDDDDDYSAPLVDDRAILQVGDNSD